CSWSKEGINLFVDDQSPVTSSYSGGIAALDTTFTLGADHKRPGNDCLNSFIDDLRISSRARSDAEILAAYQSGQPTPIDEWTTAKFSFDDKLSGDYFTLVDRD